MRWRRTRSAYCANSSPPRSSARTGWMTKVWPCGAGIAWKRDTWVVSPVVQAVSASRKAGAARVSSWLTSDMGPSLCCTALPLGGQSFVLNIEQLAAFRKVPLNQRFTRLAAAGGAARPWRRKVTKLRDFAKNFDCDLTSDRVRRRRPLMRSRDGRLEPEGRLPERSNLTM